jgi:hypothetical protein
MISMPGCPANAALGSGSVGSEWTWQPASSILGGESGDSTAVLVIGGDGYLHAVAESATPEPPGFQLSWYVLPLE